MDEKVKTREQLAALREQYQNEGKTVGYTSGVFDILHPGHVQYLQDAKSLVDVLLVGVNSDASVKANKGDSRPICSEGDRARVVAALASVSHAFIFSELNNNQNIEVLKPDLYIKAGDYSLDRLSSKALVEQYGGKVAIVPFAEGRSSSGIIEKITAAALTHEGESMVYERRPAIFVDRDGTIIEHIEYLSEPERLQEIPGSYEALKKIRELGYRVVVVTNQPGIGLGYFSKESFYAVNREMLRQATAAGCSIDRIYFCSHSKSDNCKCRKPSPYLLQRAAQECNIDLSKSFVIGDMTSDIQLARNAGCKGILVKTGRGGDDGLFPATADMEARDLGEVATYLAGLGPVSNKEVGSPISRSSVVIQQGASPVSATVVREISTVFGAVLGCAAVIDQRTRDAAGRSSIESSLAVLRKAIERGLALPHAQSDSASLLFCAEVVASIVKTSHDGAASVEVHCDQDSLVPCSEVSLSELMLALIENFLEGQPTVDSRCLALHVGVVYVDHEGKRLGLSPGKFARLSVTDTSGGPASMLDEELFNPFLSQRLRSAGKGLGATLADARTLLKRVNGSIGISASTDKATTISFYFPPV
jgi:rfaE bifunctional protein nucleotidyltransferase chain/domain